MQHVSGLADYSLNSDSTLDTSYGICLNLSRNVREARHHSRLPFQRRVDGLSVSFGCLRRRFELTLKMTVGVSTLTMLMFLLPVAMTYRVRSPGEELRETHHQFILHIHAVCLVRKLHSGHWLTCRLPRVPILFISFARSRVASGCGNLKDRPSTACPIPQ
jgi:hypothetical protein